MRDCFLDDPEQCVYVGFERLIELLGRQVGQILDELLLACHVDQQVEATEFVDGSAHDSARGLLVGEIRGSQDGRASRVANQRSDFLSVFLLGR